MNNRTPVPPLARRLAITTGLVAVALALAIVGWPNTSAARLVEVTFDDEEAGTGPSDGKAKLDNMETRAYHLGAGVIEARLIGLAQRSAITEGKYGRAADFPSALGGIQLVGTMSNKVTTFMFWIKPRNFTRGLLIHREGSFDVALSNGEIVVGAYNPQGSYVPHRTGVQVPQDGQFHHLQIIFDASGAQPKVSVAVDFQSDKFFTIAFQVRVSVAPLLLAYEFDGLLDELLILDGGPNGDDSYNDRAPLACQPGHDCLEEVFTVKPEGFPHEVPVRYRSMWDPNKCTEANPCKVVFEVSGGYKCGDDYAWPEVLLTQAGFIWVSIDPYCEGSARTNGKTELSQLIAAKNHLFSNSPIRNRIDTSSYMATGCSHGATIVSHWAVTQDDHPTRTYARSPALSAGICAYYAKNVFCPAAMEFRSKTLGAYATLLDTDLFRAAFLSASLIDHLTPAVVRDREFATSWGINTEGLVCQPDGSIGCREEGELGVPYAARRFRDVWQKMEPAQAPTGYFVEDRSMDCQHCPFFSSPAGQCGLCFLRHGRAAMAQKCPACLSYSPAEIAPGATAERCSLPANWYQDPLTPGGDGGVPGDGAPDAESSDGSIGKDAGVDPAPDASAPCGVGDCSCADSNGGCSIGTEMEATFPHLLCVLLLLALHRRPRTHQNRSSNTSLS